ncbi:MAG: hypothetical protein HY897_12935 [Deltaproteobacteria bacterium]|nr:hypothetical protein [Deltaproteobacteria bacterium]
MKRHAAILTAVATVVVGFCSACTGAGEETSLPDAAAQDDKTPPEFINASATPTQATLGQTVTLTFDSSEPLPPAARGERPNPEVTFAGMPMNCVMPGLNATCTIFPDLAMGTGFKTFTITGTDAAGNTAGPVPTDKGVKLDFTPVVTIAEISPPVVADGAAVTILFGANQALVSCWATVGGLVAACAEPQNGSECACSFVVGASTPEGTVGVQASGTNANGTGVANGKLQVDRTPPQVDGNLAAIVRRPVGSNDAVSGGAGTANDDGGDLYAERQVTAVRIWDAESAGNVVLTVTPPALQADGSFAAVELPGTGDLAPRQLWLSAVDVPGNESARVEITPGRDVDGPNVLRTLVTFF